MIGRLLAMALPFVVVLAMPRLAAAQQRWIKVVDEAGQLVPVSVVDDGDPFPFCGPSCPPDVDPELDLELSYVGVDRKPRYDATRGALLVETHPHGGQCVHVELASRDVKGERLFETDGVELSVCDHKIARIEVKRRVFEVRVRGLGTSATVKRVEKSERTPDYHVRVLEYARDDDELRFEVVLDKSAMKLEKVGVSASIENHHDVQLEVPLAEMRRTGRAAILTVSAPPPVRGDFEIEGIEFEGPSPPESEPVDVVAIDAHGKRSPCELNGLVASCPLPASGEVGTLVVSDGSGWYEDKLSCTPIRSRCTLSGTFRTPDRKRTALRAKVDPDLAEALSKADQLFAEVTKVFPGGGEVTREIKGTRGQWIVGDHLVIPLDDIALDVPDTRYVVRVRGGPTNATTRRDAIVVVGGVNKAGLVLSEHSATALRFRQLTTGVRFYVGPSFVLVDEKHAKGVRDLAEIGPAFGAMLTPELNLRRSPFALELVLGVEGERVNDGYATEDGDDIQRRWVGRALLGFGYRTRAVLPLKLVGELLVAWAPEWERGNRRSAAERLGVGLVGYRYSIDILPRFADRLRFMVGVDLLLGSRSRFVVEPGGPQIQTLFRMRAIFGVAGTLGRLILHDG